MRIAGTGTTIGVAATEVGVRVVILRSPPAVTASAGTDAMMEVSSTKVVARATR